MTRTTRTVITQRVSTRRRHGLLWWVCVGWWWMPIAWTFGYGWLWHRR